MRPFISAVLASSLVFMSPAFADTGLAPGKPAGVRAANGETREAYLLGALSGGGLLVGIYLIFIHNKKNGTAAVVSTGTAG